MQKSLNKLHYCMHLIETKLHFISNKVNPFLLLYKIPYLKRRMKKIHGTDNPLKWYNDFWTNEKDGFGINYFTHALLVGVLYLIFISIGIIIISFIKPEIVLNEYYFISLGVVSFIICHYLVFRNDVYLKYFDEFKNWTKTERRINTLSSIIFIIFTIILFFQSLINFY